METLANGAVVSMSLFCHAEANNIVLKRRPWKSMAVPKIGVNIVPSGLPEIQKNEHRERLVQRWTTKLQFRNGQKLKSFAGQPRSDVCQIATIDDN